MMPRRTLLPVLALSAVLLAGCAVTYPSAPATGSAEAPIIPTTPSSAPVTETPVEGTDTGNDNPAPIAVSGGVVDLTGFGGGFSVLLAPGSVTTFTGYAPLEILAVEGVKATPAEDGSITVTAPTAGASDAPYLVLFDKELGEVEVSIEIGEPQ